MLAQIIKDGPKNVSVLVRGVVMDDFPATPIIDIAKLTAPSAGWKGLRLDSAVWAIQEKMGLNLWWEEPTDEKALIFPMESRNSVRFDEGIPSPRKENGWSGIIHLSSFLAKVGHTPKSFFILLDFDKQ